MAEKSAYSGFRWTYFSSMQNASLRSRAEKFLAKVDWKALVKYASQSRGGMESSLLSPIGLGYNHMVRIIEFQDGTRWVARLRLPSLGPEPYPTGTKAAMESEFCTVLLVQEKTAIPVPKVHAIETNERCEVKAPFVLMDCLDGNVGMDWGMDVPNEHKQAFYKKLAEIHVELSTVRLPKIGIIQSKNDDGSYVQGPIPGIGGPFNTATEFFRAWSQKARFGMSEERLREASGEFASEIVPAVASFPESIGILADSLSVCDKGPFPLFHGDFGHNNIIVDDEYHVIGVIDWEMAFAGPWEVAGSFPLSLSIVPPAIDVPWNYDENGNPKDAELAEQFNDRLAYIQAVKEEEERLGITSDCSLSKTLEDSKRQHIITALRLYQNGKAGFYSRLIDRFPSL